MPVKLSEAIQSFYSKTKHQLCIVHQIRNSLKYVSYKHRKSLATDLKPIYTACSEEQAMQVLKSFGNKWNKQYHQIAKSWYKNWENWITFINKKVFPNDMAVFKIVYLAIDLMIRLVRGHFYQMVIKD